MDDATMATLDRIFAEQFAATGVAGLGRRGAHRRRRVDRLDRRGRPRDGRGVPAEDFVRIASITKTFTATAVLQLVDEGVVSLDDLLEATSPA